MGMFDSIYANCPGCGTLQEYQSKSGVCQLRKYTLDTAPIQVMADLLPNPGVWNKCDKCGVVPQFYVINKPTFGIRVGSIGDDIDE